MKLYLGDGEFVVQKAYRLARREDFGKVYRHGKSTANRQFVLYQLKNKEVEHFRLGISVSKKVGNAVVRNRMRRVIKEIVRHLAPRIEIHYDLILVVRKPAVEMEFDQLSKSILHVFKRGSIFRER